MDIKLVLIIVSSISVVLTGIFLFFYFNQDALPVFVQDLVGITDEKKKKALELERALSSSRKIILDKAQCLSVKGDTIPCNKVLQNANHRLVLEDDGNLVLYSIIDPTTGQITILKESKTKDKGVAPYRLVLQEDGNLIIRDSKNTAIWASGTNNLTAKNGPYTLNLSNTGRLDILNKKNEVKWSLNPPPRPTTLTPVRTTSSITPVPITTIQPTTLTMPPSTTIQPTTLTMTPVTTIKPTTLTIAPTTTLQRTTAPVSSTTTRQATTLLPTTRVSSTIR